MGMMSEHDRTTQLDATIALLVETRRQRDEALLVLREIRDMTRYTDIAYIESIIDDALAQYTEDAK